MSRETSKAMRRRWCEAESGEFPWREVFAGKGIDVGSGDDPLPLDNCQHFDKPQGDANNLGSLLPPESFDYLHASQVLEHMHDPKAALSSWITVVKPRGYLVITVPDLVLYEGMRWPSRYNGDHKSTWSLLYRRSPCPQHIFVPDFLSQFWAQVEVRLARLLDCNYNYSVGFSVDQTLPEANAVEPWIEMVLRKKCNSSNPLSFGLGISMASWKTWLGIANPSTAQSCG